MANGEKGGGDLDWDAAFPNTGESGDGEGVAPSAGGSGGGSGGKWVEGGKVERMSKAAARREIKAIESHPDFLDKEDKAAYWPRQQMLRRRSALYQHVGIEEGEEVQGMGYELKKQGMTPESLQAEIEKYEQRDFEDERSRSIRELQVITGGPEAAEAALSSGRKLVKEYGSRSLFDFLDRSGAGNDPRVIAKAAELYEMFMEVKESKKRRKR